MRTTRVLAPLFTLGALACSAGTGVPSTIGGADAGGDAPTDAAGTPDRTRDASCESAGGACVASPGECAVGVGHIGADRYVCRGQQGSVCCFAPWTSCGGPETFACCSPVAVNRPACSDGALVCEAGETVCDGGP